jgi:hypothetical protein
MNGRKGDPGGWGNNSWHYCLPPHWGIVDTLDQGPPMIVAKKQRRRTIKERRGIVEETLVPGALVARVTRRHDVNANLRRTVNR